MWAWRGRDQSPGGGQDSTSKGREKGSAKATSAPRVKPTRITHNFETVRVEMDQINMPTRDQWVHSRRSTFTTLSG